jgi:hypothetical protein
MEDGEFAFCRDATFSFSESGFQPVRAMSSLAIRADSALTISESTAL